VLLAIRQAKARHSCFAVFPPEREDPRELLARGCRQIEELMVTSDKGPNDDKAIVAFENFRRATVKLGAPRSAEEDKAALASLEPKEVVLRFLLRFHSRQRKSRSRVAAAVGTLLQHQSWSEVVDEMPEGGAVRAIVSGTANPPARALSAPISCVPPLLSIPLWAREDLDSGNEVLSHRDTPEVLHQREAELEGSPTDSWESISSRSGQYDSGILFRAPPFLACPMGHPVTKRKDGLRWHQSQTLQQRICSSCNGVIPRHATRWRCHFHCAFNVCDNCHPAVTHVPSMAIAPIKPIAPTIRRRRLRFAARSLTTRPVFNFSGPSRLERSQMMEPLRSTA
jgi:hypothetical protein